MSTKNDAYFIVPIVYSASELLGCQSENLG